ncbi:helix-turn-helix domain-containing protein [Anaerobutyricum hallii]|uniref:helix-turn-helix domain-containing protein n=1 Tax=Anaerobutyricum hallii TaxID=39488 RepID=UPI003AB3CE9E
MLEKEVIKVLEYKINVFQELKSLGITTTTAKRTGLFSQNVMKKFKNSDTSITLDNLNRLCAVLEMQPRDIIKYVETEEDREKYLLKMK